MIEGGPDEHRDRDERERVWKIRLRRLSLQTIFSCGSESDRAETSMETWHRTVLLAGWLALTSASVRAQNDSIAASTPERLPSPSSSRKLTDQPSARFFGLTNLWMIHLTVSPEEFRRMEPPGGPPFDRLRRIEGGIPTAEGGQPRPFLELDRDRAAAERSDPNGPAPPEVIRRGGLSPVAFTFVSAALEFEGIPFGRVAVRYKGNSTFASTRNVLKRSFKIDFNDYVKGQHFFGMTKLSLNCNATDPSQIREAVSYAVYQRSGVPAARTAFGRVYLTVPGTYERQHLGVYTLVEQLDERFLEDRFGTRDGLLLKPEGAQGLTHLGDDWSRYERVYDPQTRGTAADRERFLDFMRFLRDADAKEFADRIATFTDLDQLLRHLAVTKVLSNTDSITGLHHNFYIYLHPRTGKLIWLPWDLNLSMSARAGRGGGGGNPGGDNVFQFARRGGSFLARVIGIKQFEEKYREHVRFVLDHGFVPATVLADIDAIMETIGRALEEEEPVRVNDLPEPDRGFMRNVKFTRAQTDLLKEWVPARARAVEAQLAGDMADLAPGGDPREGPVLEPALGRRSSPVAPLSRPLAVKLFRTADDDNDQQVSRQEFEKAVTTLFSTWDLEGVGKLNLMQLTTGLGRSLVPPLPGQRPTDPLNAARREAARLPQQLLAAALIESVNTNGDDSLSTREFKDGLGKWFENWLTGGRLTIREDDLISGLAEQLSKVPVELLLRRAGSANAPVGF